MRNCTQCDGHQFCASGLYYHTMIHYYTTVIEAMGFTHLPVDIRDRILMGQQHYVDAFREHTYEERTFKTQKDYKG